MTLSQRVELDQEYAEWVYAGVLGELMGVYLGRPFEQWSNVRIEAELGEIRLTSIFVRSVIGWDACSSAFRGGSTRRSTSPRQQR